MNERVFWLAWHSILEGQAQKFWEIINHFGSAKEAWHAPDKEFGFLLHERRRDLSELLLKRQKTDLAVLASWMENPKFKVLLFNEDGYPDQLRNIFDPPPVLFILGDVNKLSKVSIALVGSRKATHYGLNVAEKLARDLSEAGIAITSGMARGVDTAAHRGALSAGGDTIAVLGCGIDIIYPRENEKLMRSISESGTVISEFTPGSQPEAWHFPVRNRIISGLSKAIVVIEAAERSGALITAHVALDQGREVLAVPGNITSKLSKGPNNLIKQGAAPVTGAEDILESLGMGYIFPPDSLEACSNLSLTDQEKKVYDLVEYDTISMEILVQKSGLPPGEVMTTLMFLEMKGMIKQMPGKRYFRVKN